MKRLGLIILIGSLVGCNPDDDKVFADGGVNEIKPGATLLNGIDVTDSAGLGGTEAKSAGAVTYYIEIETASGAKPCKGEVELELFTNFNLEFPKFEIQCLSMTIDLAGIFGAAGGGGFGGFGNGAEGDGNLSHDGEVLYLKNIAGATFDPPRPMLIGPIIQDPKKYKGYRKTTKHSVQGTDAKTGEAYSGSGSFTTEVIEVGTEFESDEEAIDGEFEDVIHWQITKRGFDDLKVTHGILLDKLEFWWNMRPIMIPKIVCVGDLGSALDQGDGNTTALLGTVTVTLEVIDYELD